jgi:hypothetical protein
MIINNAMDESLLSLTKQFSVIFENLDNFNEIFKNNAVDQVTEADIGVIHTKVEDFIVEAHKFIDEAKAKKDKAIKIANAEMLVSLGLSLAAMLALIPGSSVGLIIAVILLVGSIILLILGYIHAFKAQKEYDKIKDYKSKLIELKSKSENPKLKSKINDIIERINSELDIK